MFIDVTESLVFNRTSFYILALKNNKCKSINIAHTPYLATSLPELVIRTIVSDNIVAVTECTVTFDKSLKYYGMYFFFLSWRI